MTKYYILGGDPDKPINFNWKQAEYNMAFEDTNGNLLYFLNHINVMEAKFRTETAMVEVINKFALIRAPEWDWNKGIEQYTFS